MTSMPASRSARVITFAPRSCPSRPGFAMTTRSFLLSAINHQPLANNRHFLVLTPDLAQRIAHLANRRVGANGVENGRHEIRRGLGRRGQSVERSADAVIVARPEKHLELRQLLLGGGFVDVQNLDRRLVLLDEIVHADDDALFSFDGLLESFGVLGDLALRKAALIRVAIPA